MFVKLYKILDDLWPRPDINLLSKYIIDIETMRARELRNLLLSKLKMKSNIISKVIDRQELKVLALNEIIKRQHLVQSDYFKAELFKLIIFILIFIIILLMIKPLLHIGYALLNQFHEVKYQIQIKCNMLSLAYKNKYYVAVLAFFISMFLDVLSPAIQYSIIASWLGLPRFIKTFSLPVNPAMLLGSSKKSSSSSQLSKTLGNFSLDIGPMITIFLIGYAKNWLNEYGASKLIHLSHEKEKRKQKKLEKRRRQENEEAFKTHLEDLQKTYDGGGMKNPWYKNNSKNLWKDDDDDIINELLRTNCDFNNNIRASKNDDVEID